MAPDAKAAHANKNKDRNKNYNFKDDNDDNLIQRIVECESSLPEQSFFSLSLSIFFLSLKLKTL